MATGYIDQLCDCGHSRAAHRHNAAGMLDGECMCGGCTLFMEPRAKAPATVPAVYTACWHCGATSYPCDCDTVLP